ncbi:MAG TPA: hypothetical protein VMX75_00795 [Spirochaetia bacterium]|nr:hypothetical protein [Spirochaetia bacterium]
MPSSRIAPSSKRVNVSCDGSAVFQRRYKEFSSLMMAYGDQSLKSADRSAADTPDASTNSNVSATATIRQNR